MLYVFLAVLCCSATLKTVSAVKLCEPSNYICAGRCPPVPRGLQLQSQAICLKDTQGACVCFLRNPSSHIDSFFQCEVEKNGYRTQILCQAPEHCFLPGPEPGCLIIPNCSCSLYSQRAPDLKFEHWSVLKEAIVHTAIRSKEKDSEGNHKEKVQGDVREFSLKHLLFLLGFVVAPLICWCFL
ncbi:uncharacterized protein LOC118186855 [Stegodyphus dumicola]|uniref:uncharacterized protein LOC118186855 n=1 Tax=Stegodyphus dumicola TaxID=202533 RepID=UPI0015AFE9EA|nr:uncharacterized protein LOC118186855 [Stegodyphus dumicola]